MKFARPIAIATLAVVASLAGAEEKVSNPAILGQLAKAADEITNPKDGPTGLLELIEKDDRERVEADVKKASTDEYHKLAAQLNKDWKAKYGTEFRLSDHLIELQEREVERFTHDKQEYASVNFTKYGADAPFEIRMVKGKAGVWSIVLNPRLKGERLAKRLEYALRDMVESKQYWPDKEGMAYRVVARRLLDTLDYDPRKDREAAKDERDAKRKK